MCDYDLEDIEYRLDYLIENDLIDTDFWNDLENSDIGEAIDEYVRSGFDFYESID